MDAQFEEELQVFTMRLSHINDKIDCNKIRLKPNLSDKWLSKIKNSVAH